MVWAAMSLRVFRGWVCSRTNHWLQCHGPLSSNGMESSHPNRRLSNCWKPGMLTSPTAFDSSHPRRLGWRHRSIRRPAWSRPWNEAASLGCQFHPELSGHMGNDCWLAGWRPNHVDRSNHSLLGRSWRKSGERDPSFKTYGMPEIRLTGNGYAATGCR